jgi:hypothetical protein
MISDLAEGLLFEVQSFYGQLPRTISRAVVTSRVRGSFLTISNWGLVQTR